MKKKLSLLLASMLIVSLVPVSSFAGTATPESGYTIEAGKETTDTVEIAYSFGTTERKVDENDKIEFAVSNDLVIKNVKLFVDRELVTSQAGSTLAVFAGEHTKLNDDDASVVFVLTLDSAKATEGDFTVSARNVPKEETDDIKTYTMFSNKVVGTVVEKASTDFTVTALEDAKLISKDGGKTAKFEIKNIDTTTASTMTIGIENSGLSITKTKFTKNGFDVTLTTDAGKYVVPAGQKSLTVELTLSGSNKVALDTVVATVNIDGDEKDVTIAEVVDYSVSMTAVEKSKKAIPTILAGKTAEVVVTIKAVDGTITTDRAIDFVLEGADLTSANLTGFSGAAKGSTDDIEDGEFTIVPDGSNEIKFTMKLTADADAKDGVATLTANGRDLGEAITIDVLNVEKAFEIETTVTDIVRGESLETSDITITESAVGQLKVGDMVVIDLPSRLTFNELPTVEGTNGLKFDDVKFVKTESGSKTDDESQIMFKVTAKSKGEVGTITISDVAIDMATNGINGRTYAAELVVVNSGKDVYKDSDRISFGEFNIVKCVAEYDRVTAATLVFTLGSANYTINGVVSTLEAPVFTSNGRTMLPIGPLALGLGLDVNYNADTQTATFRDGATGQVVSVKENADVLYNNGIEYKMHTAAVTVNGRIFVPVASITDAFGVSIVWDEATQTVKVN